MKRRPRRASLHHREQGASAVEFAIVAPLLFMMIFGIIAFGIVFAQDLALSNGARQAARTGAVPATGDCESIYDSLVNGTTTIALDQTAGGDFDFQVYRSSDTLPANRCPGPPFASPAPVPCIGAASGEEIVVVAQYDTSFSVPFVGAFAPTLTREGTYRCEFSETLPAPSPSPSAAP